LIWFVFRSRAVASYTALVTIIEWNGADVPAELRKLPAGTYVIQRADDALAPEGA